MHETGDSLLESLLNAFTRDFPGRKEMCGLLGDLCHNRNQQATPHLTVNSSEAANVVFIIA